MDEPERVIGACIMPFCIDPVWGRMYFLLGKERYTSNWVRASELWSCFGGRPANRGEAVENIAAREFLEETCGMVKFFESDMLPRTEHADISTFLASQKFLLRINMVIKPVETTGKTADAHKLYTVFVPQIPWDPQCVLRFGKCRSMLATMRLLPPTRGRLRWMLAHPALHVFPRTEQDSAEIMQQVVICKVPAAVAAAAKRGRCKEALLADVEAAAGRLVVNKDYLEKQALALWSVPQLLRAVRTCGILSTRGGKVERCRASFAQHAAIVLSELVFSAPCMVDCPVGVT